MFCFSMTRLFCSIPSPKIHIFCTMFIYRISCLWNSVIVGCLLSFLNWNFYGKVQGFCEMLVVQLDWRNTANCDRSWSTLLRITQSLTFSESFNFFILYGYSFKRWFWNLAWCSWREREGKRERERESDAAILIKAMFPQILLFFPLNKKRKRKLFFLLNKQRK